MITHLPALGYCSGPTLGMKGHSIYPPTSPIWEPHSDGHTIIRMDISPQKRNICIKNGASLGTNIRQLFYKLIDFGLESWSLGASVYCL